MRGIRSDEIRRLVMAAEDAGWNVELRGSGHLLLTSPNGKHKTMASTTARGHRNAMNLRAALRRAGLPV